MLAGHETLSLLVLILDKQLCLSWLHLVLLSSKRLPLATHLTTGQPLRVCIFSLGLPIERDCDIFSSFW